MTNARSILLYSVLPIAVVVTIVEVTNRYHGMLPAAGPPVDLKTLPEFLGRLQVLWDRYLEMIQLLITLLTGVVAVSSGIVRFGGNEPVADRGFYAAGMTSLLIALAMAVLWRADAQLLMEIEIFGRPSTAMAYYAANGLMRPFTTSFEYLDQIRDYGDAAKIFMFGTAYGLIAGLAFLARFAFSNMPEASRPRSRLSGSHASRSN